MLAAVANFLISENLVDMDYVNKYTLGFDDFSEHAGSLVWNLPVKLRGFRKEIRDFALLITKKKA